MLRLLHPRWLARHAALLVALAGFAVLGRWQWDVAGSHGGSLQNSYYAIQWWAFGVIAVVVWAKAIRLETPAGQRAAAAKRAARDAAAAAMARSVHSAGGAAVVRFVAEADQPGAAPALVGAAAATRPAGGTATGTARAGSAGSTAPGSTAPGSTAPGHTTPGHSAPGSGGGGPTPGAAPARGARAGAAEPTDAELAAYNAYLAHLNAHPRR